MHTRVVFILVITGCWITIGSAQSTNVTETTTFNTTIGGQNNLSTTNPLMSSTDGTIDFTNVTTMAPASENTSITTVGWNGSTIVTTSTVVPKRPDNKTQETSNCPSVTPADIIDIADIEGVWYVQAYTGQSTRDQITECDQFNITINKSNRQGSIVYTFLKKGDNHPTVEVANVYLLPEQAQFFYNVTGLELNMTTTILVCREDEAYIHIACPADLNKPPTLVIATKERTVSPSMVDRLAREAFDRGATIDVRRVNNDGGTCALN